MEWDQEAVYCNRAMLIGLDTMHNRCLPDDCEFFSVSLLQPVKNMPEQFMDHG